MNRDDRAVVESAPTIEDYGLLSDCQGAALVSGDGSFDWACLPRFDSSSIFARLLDPAAGHCSLAPVAEVHECRRALRRRHHGVAH